VPIQAKLTDDMRVMKGYKWATAGLIVVCAVVFGLSTAGAFSINPYKVEMTLPAGESREGSFTLANPSDTTVNIKVTVEDWSSDQDDGRVIVRGEKPSLNWLKLTPQELELGPQQSKVVNYTVRLPKGTKGERSAMVYFGDVPDTSKGGIAIRSRIGTAVYAIAEGTEIVKGEISRITVARQKPLRIDVAVKSLSNIHIRPKGIIRINNKEGGEPIEILFNDPGFPVLPQQEYKFEARSKKKLGQGEYKLEFDMQFGEEEFHEEMEFTVN